MENKIITQKRINSWLSWLSVIAVALLAVGVDWHTWTSWEIMFKSIQSILENPMAIICLTGAIIGIFNDPTRKNGF